jgi:hypothetical protein
MSIGQKQILKLDCKKTQFGTFSLSSLNQQMNNCKSLKLYGHYFEKMSHMSNRHGARCVLESNEEQDS